jgi:hypothetical protein
MHTIRFWRGIGPGIFLTTTLLVWLTAGGCLCFGQSKGAARLTTGREIYQGGCAGCHGDDGRGAPQSTIGFTKPDTFPDFTRCDQTTPEDNLAWKSVIWDGGPSRGFSQIMPSFKEALTDEQVDRVIGYMRGFCKEKGWPRGELNLPLPLVTEKAFPEDEEVLTSSANVTGTPSVSGEVVHEQRFGRKNQIEATVPVNFERPAPGRWYGGVGDISLGLKRVLFSSLETGSILSLQGEVIAPTGNVEHGLGSGVTTFETFAAFAQLLPWQSFVQIQSGAVLPRDTAKAPQNIFFHSALGKSFAQSEGLGRLWSPMVEFIASRDLVDGAKTDWDVVPEFQVSLSRRQHIRMAAGVSIPVTDTVGRSLQAMVYVLWDWQDGKLWEGW